MMPTYKVKENRNIEHDSKAYFGGQTIELPEELAILHGENVELVKSQKVEQEKPQTKETKSNDPGKS